MINGWYCPQCKKLTEHIYIYKRNITKHLRCLQCTVCKLTTPSKATTNYTEKREARLGSRLKNSGHYHGNGKTNGWIKYPKTGKDPRLQVEKHKIWGRPSSV